ncbi:MAG: cytochrome c [Gammaproteobacteria bacterium]|nr:cytochrome c [Gammaproteobacteria bacterium]
MRYLPGAILILVVGVVAAGAWLWSGSYNVAADEPHWPLVHRALELGRERSIAQRVAAVEVPDLTDPERLAQGAGNYAAMCETCHLRPGLADSELRRGLYPRPPALATRDAPDPARDFWIIKHGLKASGMPAWGRSMGDDTIWGMVAFMRTLPGQSADDYATAVTTSGGHDHGDAESAPAPEEGPVKMPARSSHDDDHDHKH